MLEEDWLGNVSCMFSWTSWRTTQSLQCGVQGGAVGCYEKGDVAYIILPWFGSQIFKKLPGVSGSIRPKPVLIKSLRLGRI